MDIVFHIGYPKTATSVMQRGVFRAWNALGVDTLNEHGRQLEFTIRNIVQFGDPGIWATSRGAEIGRRIEDLSPGSNRMLYSSEYWLRGPCAYFLGTERPRVPGKRAHSATEHLEAFNRHVWAPRGRVRVLFVVRRQSAWLGSFYAQVSDRRKKAGQADFEKLVHTVLNDPSAGGRLFLDYNQLYEDLCEGLGQENVLPLMYEEFGTAPFWDSLTTWSGFCPDDIPGASQVKYNVRSVGTDQWRLRPSSSLVRSRPFEFVDFALKRHAGIDLRKPVKRLVSRLSSTQYIHLPPEMETDIAACYRRSNIKLAEKTGMPLDRHGYM